MEGGGVHSCRKYVEKHSTNLDMSKKALVKKISMLKSNYVEAGREQPGYKNIIGLPCTDDVYIVQKFITVQDRPN